MGPILERSISDTETRVSRSGHQLSSGVPSKSASSRRCAGPHSMAMVGSNMSAPLKWQWWSVRDPTGPTTLRGHVLRRVTSISVSEEENQVLVQNICCRVVEPTPKLRGRCGPRRSCRGKR